MGRWSTSSKSEADSVKKIAMSFLKKHDYLCGWRSGNLTWTNSWSEEKSSVGIEVSTMNDDHYIRIHYTQTDNESGEKKGFDYKVPLTTTSCHFGGKRYWFTCPWYKNGVYCGRRVGVLYKNGSYFACRHCYNLTYSSKNQNYRNKLFPLFSILNAEQKIEKLEEEIKTPYYRGKPTRKQRRLERLYRQIDRDYQKSELVL